MYAGPTRGGARGGRAEFSWEQVKNDEHRENYLGHSVLAPVGRWQKGRDINWYNKDASTSASASDEEAKREARRKELQAIKQREEEELNKRLGRAGGLLSGHASSGGAVIGDALARGSASSAAQASGSGRGTGTNTAPLDMSLRRQRGWGSDSASHDKGIGSAVNGSFSSDNIDAETRAVEDSLSKEERKAARKLARREVRERRHEDHRQRKEERRQEREGRSRDNSSRYSRPSRSPRDNMRYKDDDRMQHHGRLRTSASPRRDERERRRYLDDRREGRHSQVDARYRD